MACIGYLSKRSFYASFQNGIGGFRAWEREGDNLNNLKYLGSINVSANTFLN